MYNYEQLYKTKNDVSCCQKLMISDIYLHVHVLIVIQTKCDPVQIV